MLSMETAKASIIQCRIPTELKFEAFTYPHPTDGHPVLFVDTPGFDEEVKSATTVLSELAKWLKKK